MCVCSAVQKNRQGYNNQMTPSVWLSKPEFASLTAVFISSRSPSHRTKLTVAACFMLCNIALLRRKLVTEKKRHERGSGLRWKKDIHPGNASKQENVATFSHDPFDGKKSPVLFFLNFSSHQNCH